MRKILSLFTAMVLLATVSFAQKRETRDVSAFTKISFRSSGIVYVKQGSPQKIEIEGSAESLEKIKTKVEDGKLSIGPEEKWNNWSWNDDGKVTVYVTVASIETLSVSGSGDMIVETKITGNNLKLNVSGSGSLKADIDVTGDVDVDVSGSGDMNLKGKCKSFTSDLSGSGSIKLNAVIAGLADFDISGSGEVEASGSSQSVKAEITGSGKVLAVGLETDKCSARISGSGDIEINVKSELDARITGSGTVGYKGDPARVNSDASGSGKVRKL